MSSEMIILQCCLVKKGDMHHELLEIFIAKFYFAFVVWLF